MQERLVLHSSPVRLIGSLVSPALLLAFAAWITATRGVHPVPLIIGAVGLVLLLVALLDVPLRAEFDAEGVTRVCALRRHRLPWSQVNAVVRTARPRRARPGPDAPAGPDGPPRTGGPRPTGLVARVGRRRRYLLTDRCESYKEHKVLRSLVADSPAILSASQPPLDTPPASRGATRVR